MPLFGDWYGAKKEVGKLFCGIGGVKRELSKMYAGISGVKREIFSGKEYLKINLINSTTTDYYAKNGISVFSTVPPAAPTRIYGVETYEKGLRTGIHLYGMNYWYLYINGTMDDSGIGQANGIVVSRLFDRDVEIEIENDGNFASVFVKYI